MTPHEVVRRLIAEAIGQTVGDRIRPDRRYQEDQLPAVAYTVEAAEPRRTLSGQAAAQYSGEIVIWTADCRQAVELAEAVAAQNGTEVENEQQLWTWLWTGGGFAADLVEEETDRPEYQATVRYVLWCT